MEQAYDGLWGLLLRANYAIATSKARDLACTTYRLAVTMRKHAIREGTSASTGKLLVASFQLRL